MNKDVVYIEPEDDITDIITRIENAKGKIVALVPPKRAGVFRSLVNIKLIAKAGKGAQKTVVLVTTDPSIMKLAAATKLPVTKNLQTAPAVPDGATITETAVKDVIADEASEDGEEIVKVVDGTGVDSDDDDSEADSDRGGASSDRGDTDSADSDGNDADSDINGADDALASDSSAGDDEEPSKGGPSEKGLKTAKNGLKTQNADDEEGENGANGGKNGLDEDTEDEDGDEDDNKAKNGKKSRKKDKLSKEERKNLKKFSKEWFVTYKWRFICGGLGVVALVVLLVWMFVIAPKATISVDIRTTTANFSENIKFTSTPTEEDAEAGVFLLTEKKVENKSEVEFTATGQKNVGTKATGKLTVYSYFYTPGSLTVPSGATFTVGGKSFTVDTGATLTLGSDISVCDSVTTTTSGIRCQIYGTVTVTATGAGTEYNLDTSSGWTSSISDVWVATGSTSGGTDEMVTVVQQSDIDKAKGLLSSSEDSKGKSQLFNMINEKTEFVIEASYAQTVSDAVSSPAVGEEVKDGAKAKLTVVTTDSVYLIDKVKVEEFIAHKAKLSDGFKIYSMNDPFVENFVVADGSGTGKLKTSYVSGPSVTENDIVEMARGKGVGTATHDISGLDGIKSVTIDTPYFWVTSVPNDPNRITVVIDSREYEQ